MNPNHSKPRSAATVVIVRQGDELPEVLMLRRHSRAVFASHYVFPGGVLEPCDGADHARGSGSNADVASKLLGLDDAQDYYSAAIREAFEEAGILLARDASGDWGLAGKSAAEIRSYRDSLNNSDLDWPDFLQQQDLYPAYDALYYIAYWVTPRVQKKRFSTRFFLALAPTGQQAVHDDGELTDSCWMTANDILEAGQRGEMQLMYPTVSTLSAIAKYHSVDGIIEWAHWRGQSGEARMLPAFVAVDGRDTVVMPDSQHYPRDFDT